MCREGVPESIVVLWDVLWSTSRASVGQGKHVLQLLRRASEAMLLRPQAVSRAGFTLAGSLANCMAQEG